jgi:hypothetical protein
MPTALSQKWHKKARCPTSNDKFVILSVTKRLLPVTPFSKHAGIRQIEMKTFRTFVSPRHDFFCKGCEFGANLRISMVWGLHTPGRSQLHFPSVRKEATGVWLHTRS